MKSPESKGKKNKTETKKKWKTRAWITSRYAAAAVNPAGDYLHVRADAISADDVIRINE